MHFPKVAARYQKNVDDIGRKYNGKIKPHFGLFWNFCLNSEFGEVERVHCLPHVDSKNLAMGLCALYVYGEPFSLLLYLLLKFALLQVVSTQKKGPGCAYGRQALL
jgi:hypothetical protein